ncbi:MAG: ATP-dependent helicase [Haliangiales bacterium]
MDTSGIGTPGAGTPAFDLADFIPATARWFRQRFDAPTAVQSAGWAQIATGHHTLLIAPTGSGKTLAAFLWCIDRLIAAPAPEGGVSVLYISPLKALVYDVERNLRDPLLGIARAADELGARAALPTVGVRTGDTSAGERRRLLRQPSDILVTTPESLYLMLGSQARETLRSVRTVIVDEVHSLAPTKRGAHLALSLERLEAICEHEPQRIGLSATARPLAKVARYLGGARPVEIVDAGALPALDLEVIVPVVDMTRPDPPPEDTPQEGAGALKPDAEKGLWPTIYPRLLALIQEHRSTILFVNSRGLCERLTQRLNELAEGPLCRSHHGSLSHAERRVIEDQLKAGHIRAIVATSSLELGIDMGAVDLVVLVGSPGAVARGLQRVGRAGHGVGEVSAGRIFPKHRGDLLEAAVIAERMYAGAIETIALPENPLDVLAQQIVAAVAVEDWEILSLRRLVMGAANYAELPESAFMGVLDMLSGLYPSHAFANLAPRVVWDRERDILSSRRGSKMLSLVSGGTIPDRGLYGVYLADGSARVGELDEEMVYETVPGHIITLGASSWRVEQITRDRVLVTPAPGQSGRLPFWHGEGPGRPVALGYAVGAFVREIGALSEEDARGVLRDRYHLDELAAGNLWAYLDEQAQATGTPPTDQAIVVERFRDELGDWRVCVLSPFGAKVHAPWAQVIESKLSRVAGFDVQTMWSDDGIALRLADTDELPDVGYLIPDPDDVEAALLEQLGSSALFASQFRENAARSLLLPRQRPGKRMPLWVQRLKSQELLAVARQFPAFPVIMETYRSCLKDVFDVPALVELLRAVRSRAIRVVEVETGGPSPFARSLAFAYVATYLYEGDAPLAERRAQALTLDRKLLGELLGYDELRALLDAEVIADVERELQGLSRDRRARHADDLHRLLRRVGDLSRAELAARAVSEIGADVAKDDGAGGGADAAKDDGADDRAGAAAPLLAALLSAARAACVSVAGQERVVAVEDVGLYRDALGVAPPPGTPAVYLDPVPDALSVLLLRYSRCHGPFTSGEVADRYQLPVGVVETCLAGLVQREELARGGFRPDGSDREWCHLEVLQRIKRRTLAALRAEVAAVEPRYLGRFLPRWHGVGAGMSGITRLREVIAQLEGLPLSYAELEQTILPARVDDFRPSMLDELGAVGWLSWVGHGALGSRDGRVALYRREQVPYLLDLAPPPESLSPLARTLLAALEARGASFFVALQAAAPSESLDDLVAAVRELMWAGLITNDTFAPLRARVAAGRPSRGRTRAQLQAVGGRWSPTRELLWCEPSDTERAHARAVTLLERHGVVCREVNVLEPASGGFSGLYPVLREMEEAGKARRGYFVDRVGGVQFALPGAVDRLRAARQGDPRGDHELCLLAASDPANPYGWFLPWPVRDSAAGEGGASGPRRVTGAFVVLAGGEPVLYLGPGGKQLVTFPVADERALFVAAVGRLDEILARTRRKFLRIERIDGERAGRSGFADALLEAGFHRVPNGFERERR